MLAIKQNCTKMHGQQNIIFYYLFSVNQY